MSTLLEQLYNNRRSIAVVIVSILVFAPQTLYASIDLKPLGNITKVVLDKNMLRGVNTLTKDMINQANTTYVIKYNYVLDSNILVPDNCILEFDGGSISGEHTVVFQNTLLDGDVKFHKIKPVGEIRNAASHIKWFIQNGDDASDIIKYLISTSSKIIIDEGIWHLSKYIKLQSNITIEGVNSEESILKFDFEHFDLNTGWYGMFGTDDQSMYDKYLYTKKDSDGEKRAKRKKVILENVSFNNITFDKGAYVNQHACIEFIQARNCNVYNCIFKYDKGNPKGLCNITASIVHIYSKKCNVENNLCLDDVLVASSYSDDITIAHNKLYRVRATGIETDNCTHVYVIDNYVKDNYGPESTVGINSANSVVRGNTIILSGEDGTNNNSFSCLTINHQTEDVKSASNIVVENNHLESSVSPVTCLLVQCGKNITIRNNTIRGTVKEEGSLIGILGGLFDNIEVSNNTVEQTDMTLKSNGIYLRNNSDLPKGKYIEIGNNSVNAYNGIYVAGIKKSKIFGNEIDAVNRGIVINGYSSTVRNNVITNCTNAMMAFCDFTFDNNIVQSCGAININNSDDTEVKKVRFKNNTFERPRSNCFVGFNSAPNKVQVSNNTFDIATNDHFTVTRCVSFSPAVTRTISNNTTFNKWRFKKNTILGIASGKSCDIYSF